MTKTRQHTGLNPAYYIVSRAAKEWFEVHGGRDGIPNNIRDAWEWAKAAEDEILAFQDPDYCDLNDGSDEEEQEEPERKEPERKEPERKGRSGWAKRSKDAALQQRLNFEFQPLFPPVHFEPTRWRKLVRVDKYTRVAENMIPLLKHIKKPKF